MLGSVDSESGRPPGRREEIDTRLQMVRARLKELRERDLDYYRRLTVAPGGRVEAARRHAAAAHDAAMQVLASSAEAFRHAAEAHDQVASMHERAATAGTGDVLEHERQATLHRAAAQADRQRAERAQSLLFEAQRVGPAGAGDEPGHGVIS